MKTISKKQSKEVVQDFFNAFSHGDFNGVINSFHDSCTVIAIRDAERSNNQIYGTYRGKDGAQAFLSNLGNTFDTKAFSVENIIEVCLEAAIVFFNKIDSGALSGFLVKCHLDKIVNYCARSLAF